MKIRYNPIMLHDDKTLDKPTSTTCMKYQESIVGISREHCLKKCEFCLIQWNYFLVKPLTDGFECRGR